jgi:hypothetical protein
MARVKSPRDGSPPDTGHDACDHLQRPGQVMRGHADCPLLRRGHLLPLSVAKLLQRRYRSPGLLFELLRQCLRLSSHRCPPLLIGHATGPRRTLPPLIRRTRPAPIDIGLCHHQLAMRPDVQSRHRSRVSTSVGRLTTRQLSASTARTDRSIETARHDADRFGRYARHRPQRGLARQARLISTDRRRGSRPGASSVPTIAS